METKLKDIIYDFCEQVYNGQAFYTCNLFSSLDTEKKYGKKLLLLRSEYNSLFEFDFPGVNEDKFHALSDKVKLNLRLTMLLLFLESYENRGL